MILEVCLIHCVRNTNFPLGILMLMAWFMGRFAIVKDLGIFSTPGVDVGSQFLRLVDQPNPSQTLQLLTSGPVAVILSSKLLPPTRLLWFTSMHGFSRTGSYSNSPATLTPSVPQTEHCRLTLVFARKLVPSQSEKVEVKCQLWRRWISQKGDTLVICEAVGTLLAVKVTQPHWNGISHSEKKNFSLTIRSDHSVTVEIGQQSVNSLSCDPCHSFLED